MARGGRSLPRAHPSPSASLTRREPPSQLPGMRTISAMLFAVSVLAGCRGYTPGPQQAYWADPAPPVASDGFYDGGIFDQDLFTPDFGGSDR